jgi:Fe-S cluster assembly protein SufD
MKLINLNTAKNKSVTLSERGEYIAVMKNISGDFQFVLDAEGIDLKIFGIFSGKNADDYRVRTLQHHTAPNSQSNLLIKGVFQDESKFHYQGLIKIEKSGQNTKAYQKNQNLVLSSGVFVESEPFLEILANEVFCTHGSTTGTINEEDLYYIMTRGIQREAAQALIVEGFLGEVEAIVKGYGYK